MGHREVLTLDEACNASFLSSFYDKPSANAVADMFKAFAPLSNNCKIVLIDINTDNKLGPLCLTVEVSISSSAKRHEQNNAGMNYHGMSYAPADTISAHVALFFPRAYPQCPLEVYVLPRPELGQVLCSNHMFVDSSGKVSIRQMEQLTERELSVSIFTIVTGVQVVLDNYSPFVHDQRSHFASLSPARSSTAYYSGVYAAAAGAKAPNAYSNDTASALNSLPTRPVDGAEHKLPSLAQKPVAERNATAEELAAHDALVSQAAHAVMSDLDDKMKAYLKTQRSTQDYMSAVRDKHDEMMRAINEMDALQTKLLNYVQPVSDVVKIRKDFTDRENSIEEHENCLVGENELQTRSVELIAQIHASEDALQLIEEGLRMQQLSCEEYVKYVSQLARDQFMARFLQQRLINLANSKRSSAHIESEVDNANTASKTLPPIRTKTSPVQVPQKLSPRAALQKMFPKVEVTLIDDVLANVNNDVKDATEQMRKLLAA